MNSNLYFLIKRKIIPALLICVFSILISEFNPLNATHVVGGQLSYKHLGKGFYEVTLLFRRDCGRNTEPIDNPALLGVFYNGFTPQKAYKVGVDGVVPMKLLERKIIQDTTKNICQVTCEDSACVEQALYREIIYLPLDDRGYILVYQRCCRNKCLLNIEGDPLEVGSTFIATVTPENQNDKNTLPDFGENFPPISYCVDKPFNFFSTAIDPDSNDSLVYSFCTPYKGKTMAFPGGRPDDPPYDTLKWKSPYNLNNLIGSPLTIDPKTGEISGTPREVGQFLIGICVSEYRNGKLRGFSRRDLQLNIVPCGTRPTASFSINSLLCDGLTVNFANQSTNSIKYTWYFDWHNNRNLSSTDINPSFTYSKPGKYEVVLVAINEHCMDTSRLIINVIDPKLIVDFDYNVDCKNQASIQIIDKSSSNGTITNRLWMLSGPKDTLISTLKDPLFTLKGVGKITIKLTITDENGCIATVSKILELNLIDVKLISDSLTICQGDSTKLVSNPDPTLIYKWDPTNSLNLSNPSNPIAKPATTTTYFVTITDGPCTAVSRITVFVRDKIEISLSGDTLVCDGQIDLTAKSDSATTFIWSLNASFNPILFTGDHYIITASGTKTYYIKGGNGDQCPDTASITVTDGSIKLNYNDEYTVCTNDTFTINLVNSNPSHQLSITWLANPIIIGKLDTLTPRILCTTPGKYVLYFTVKNQFDCDLTDSIIINAVLAPNPEFSIENDCGSLVIRVNTNGNGNISWDFGDGIGSSHEKSTSYKYTKHGKYIVKLIVDSICIRSLEKEITVVELISNLEDTITSCFSAPVQLNPGGNKNYRYEWTPIGGLNDPKSPNPTATVSTTTKYYVTIIDPEFPDSCALIDSITVLVPPTLEIKAESDTTLCEKTKITLKVSSNLIGTKFEWCDEFNHTIGKSNEIEVNPDSSTFYIVKAIDTFGCSLRDTLVINLVEIKTNLADTIISCFGEPVHLNPGANPNYHYEWSPTNGLDDPKSPNPTASVSISTKYYVTIIDPTFPDFCFLKDSICVFVPPALKIKAESDTTLCKKAKITLKVSSNLSGTEYEWCDEFGKSIGKSTELEVTPEKSTFYVVKAFDEFGCAARDTVFVELFELDAKLSETKIICIGDTTFIKVLSGIGTNYKYMWSPTEFIIGSTTDSIIYINPEKTTTYTVKIINDHNCDWELSKTVEVSNPKSILTVKADPKTIVSGQKTQLTATFNSNWKYLWSPQDSTLSDSSIYNPVANPVKTTSYTVTVTDENDCTATDVVTVTVITCFESVFIPNAFSPNGDHKNDTLYVRSLPNTITKMELLIFSRWGEKVFSTTDKNLGWDGRFKDEELPPGVFGYGLKFTCHELQEYIKKGNVSIIK